MTPRNANPLRRRLAPWLTIGLCLGVALMVILIGLFWRFSGRASRDGEELAGLVTSGASEVDVRARFGAPYLVVTGDEILRYSQQFENNSDLEHPLDTNDISHMLFYRDAWYTMLVYIGKDQRVIGARVGVQ